MNSKFRSAVSHFFRHKDEFRTVEIDSKVNMEKNKLREFIQNEQKFLFKKISKENKVENLRR